MCVFICYASETKGHGLIFFLTFSPLLFPSSVLPCAQGPKRLIVAWRGGGADWSRHTRGIGGYTNLDRGRGCVCVPKECRSSVSRVQWVHPCHRLRSFAVIHVKNSKDVDVDMQTSQTWRKSRRGTGYGDARLCEYACAVFLNLGVSCIRRDRDDCFQKLRRDRSFGNRFWLPGPP